MEAVDYSLEFLLVVLVETCELFSELLLDILDFRVEQLLFDVVEVLEVEGDLAVRCAVLFTAAIFLVLFEDIAIVYFLRHALAQENLGIDLILCFLRIVHIIDVQFVRYFRLARFGSLLLIWLLPRFKYDLPCHFFISSDDVLDAVVQF